MDTWESEQNQWTETLTVLKHFEALLERATDDSDNTAAAKKRKIDANNKNYIVAGIDELSYCS